MRKNIALYMFMGVSFYGCTHAKIKKKPNIIYILADDLGYGDLSCYGQKKINTPNIDKLASEGMSFTQHYSGCTVCAPSRSCLLSGQHTGHTFIRGNVEVQPEGQLPIPSETFTLAKMLKKNGYKTGAFGKWGLGFPGSQGDPNFQGFDEFFGYNCQLLAHHYYPDHLWHNQNKVVLSENKNCQKKTYAPILIQEEALNFIENNKENPFFLYMPTIMPHAELAIPEENLKKYRGKFLPEKIYKGVNGIENYVPGGYCTQLESHAAFAAMIDLLDQQVGEIIDKVKTLGIEDNTIIVFTSDNGPHMEGGADPDYFNSNGILRGYKRDLYEGGIRVPLIVKWPNKIKTNSKSDHISAFWDIMPTFADIVNEELDTKIDGLSILPTLLNKGIQKQHEALYWEFHELGGRQAIRNGDWKLIKLNAKNSNKTVLELYDLKKDPSEKYNLADSHSDIVQEMSAYFQNSREISNEFPDL
ncbi:MAG: arylsulfatase [Marinilabiliaceae bacterium]|nr:arylsulfatase [Marinilabiliaceae bacterium]